MKHIQIASSLTVIIMLLVWIALVATVSFDEKIRPNHWPDQDAGNILYRWHVDSAHSHSRQFPFSDYLGRGQLRKPASYLRDLQVLDSLFPNVQGTNEQTLILALTDSLAMRIEPRLSDYQIDSLIPLIHWATSMTHYAEMSKNHGMLFEMLHHFWMNKAVNTLETYHDKRPVRKYHFKFRYARSQCELYNFNTSIGNSKTEKLIYRMLDGRWSYILKRMLYATSWWQKTIIILFILLTIYGFICIIRTHLNFNR